MYLQYSRYLRRNLALCAVHILLTIAVIGLLLILFVSNSRTDLPFMVRPRLDKPASVVAVNRISESFDSSDSSLDLSTSTNLVDNTKIETLEGAGIEINTEAEQQHIYIDDVYNANHKLHKEEFVPITDGPNDMDVDGDSSQGSGTLVGNAFNFNEFDDDNDDDDPVISGSGNNRGTIYDLETKDFIKRISIKLSQFSKANKVFKLGKNSLINRELVPIPDNHHRSATGDKRTPPKTAFAPQKKIGIETGVLSSSRGLLKPTVIRAPPFATLEKQLIPSETPIRTRRIITNEKKSEERSRKLLLCESEMGNSGGRELCRMLFKETES